MTQFGSEVYHPCPKKGGELVQLVAIATTPAVDLFCDGCGVERSGAEHHVYTDKGAKDRAREAGWVCNKKEDFCPKCAFEKGLINA
jgi:hypothetical protein